MKSHIRSPGKRKKAKSSLTARRLIRAAIKKYGSQRAAARALELPGHGQLWKMLKGQLADTPEMKTAIARAERRAYSAYFFHREDELEKKDLKKLERAFDLFSEVLKAYRLKVRS